MNDKPMQALEAEMAPILAAFSDEIVQNPQLFARIKAVYDGRQAAKLEPDQLRLVETIYEAFARNGAALDDKGKARLKDINAKLASLYTKFSQNELHDEETGLLLLESEADLAGLPDSVKQGARDGGRGEAAQGQVGDHQHALVGRAVLDLFDPARSARKGLADVDQPRRQRRARTTTSR